MKFTKLARQWLTVAALKLCSGPMGACYEANFGNSVPGKKSTHEIVDSLRAKKIAEKKLGARKHSFSVPFTIKFFSVFPRLSDYHFKIYSTQLFPFIGRNENQTPSLESKDFTIPVKNLKNLARKKGAGRGPPCPPPLAQALK